MSHATLRADARACFDAALAAVDPRRVVARGLVATDQGLALRSVDGTILARHDGSVLLVSVGKAAVGMAHAVAVIAGAQVQQGVVLAPHGSVGSAPAGLVLRHGAHPTPDAAGAAATGEIFRMVGSARPRTLVLLALSGGASSLLVAPPAGVTLDDKRELARGLLAAGADIHAFNAVRKHCSRVKGGGLARAAAGSAGVWTLALSDVVGDDLATIGSGPAVADPTTFADAAGALERWLSPGEEHARIRAHLAAGRAGERAETVKPGDPVLARVHAVVVGGNHDACDAAARVAVDRGYAVRRLGEPMQGDAAVAGERIARVLLGEPHGRRVAVIAGGETSVRAVAGGTGGRSQHLALAAAPVLEGTSACLLAAGTDGFDGPTSAAGGCVDGASAARARAAGIDLDAALARTDSHRVLATLGDLVVTGPTGTNVADVVVALRDAC